MSLSQNYLKKKLWHFQNMKLAFEIGGDFVSKVGHFVPKLE